MDNEKNKQSEEPKRGLPKRSDEQDVSAKKPKRFSFSDFKAPGVNTDEKKNVSTDAPEEPVDKTPETNDTSASFDDFLANVDEANDKAADATDIDEIADEPIDGNEPQVGGMIENLNEENAVKQAADALKEASEKAVKPDTKDLPDISEIEKQVTDDAVDSQEKQAEASEEAPQHKHRLGLPRRDEKDTAAEAAGAIGDLAKNVSEGMKADEKADAKKASAADHTRTPLRKTHTTPRDKSNRKKTSAKAGGAKRENKDNMPKGLPSKKKNPKKKKWRAWQKVLAVIGVLIVAGFVAIIGLYEYNRVDISDYKYTQKQKTQVISADNQVIGQLYSQNRTYVSLNQVPDNMKKALIATEDSRFYDHHGVDYFGIFRSLVRNIVSRDATSQGASTITQQLARLLFLPDISTEQTVMDSINRKFKEISIARQLEHKYSKNQILEMYLNEYYFGSSAYGIEEAAKTYFGKDIWDCNLAECAMLAGLPQAPSGYAPNAHFDRAKKRQAEVLNRMRTLGYITAQQEEEAKNTPITIAKWDASKLNNQITEGYEKFVNRALQQYAESQASDVMKKQGISKKEAINYTRTRIASGGYKVYTTINTGMQQQAIDISKSRYPSGSSTTDAIVTLDLDGSVRAYYGGNTQIDMCNTARQPGSSIKPLYYSGAIDQGLFTANSVLRNSGSYGGWSPATHGGATATLRTAIVQSYNSASAYVMYKMGVKNAINWMKTMGITTFVDGDYYLPTAIGGMTNGFKPIESAAAYNVFNNSGVYNEPKYVTKIENANGKTIFKDSDLNLDTHQVMKQSTATTMKSILRGVVTSGTGTAANVYGTAGKTGTTDSGKDLWFVGMTGNITTAIWVGNLNNVAIGGYGSLCAGIYGTYMRNLGSNNLIPGISN